MRTATTIFLLVLFTATQTPLGQLLKLPVLMEHFYKHKKQEGTSLLEFLSDHYATAHNDADQAEDETLPFKTLLLPGIGVALLPEVAKTDFALAFGIPAKVMLQQCYSSQQHLSRIFHPPRL